MVSPGRPSRSDIPALASPPTPARASVTPSPTELKPSRSRPYGTVGRRADEDADEQVRQPAGRADQADVGADPDSSVTTRTWIASVMIGVPKSDTVEAAQNSRNPGVGAQPHHPQRIGDPCRGRRGRPVAAQCDRSPDQHGRRGRGSGQHHAGPARPAGRGRRGRTACTPCAATPARAPRRTRPVPSVYLRGVPGYSTGCRRRSVHRTARAAAGRHPRVAPAECPGG